jgi:hypothetical protein
VHERVETSASSATRAAYLTRWFSRQSMQQSAPSKEMGSDVLLLAPTCNRFFVRPPHHISGLLTPTDRSIRRAASGDREGYEVAIFNPINPHALRESLPMPGDRRPAMSPARRLITWEFPRLCRGGSRSLTYTAVVQGRSSRWRGTKHADGSARPSTTNLKEVKGSEVRSFPSPSVDILAR